MKMAKNTNPDSLASPPVLDNEVVVKLLTSFIESEIHRTGHRKGVVGLSGGLDSAVVAALMVKALGHNHCLGILLPHRTSSPSSRDDALTVAKHIQLPTEIIDISSISDCYLTEDHSSLRKGNFFARIRMSVLFDIAMRDHALVVGTSNKTELLLGYSTWFGDGAWSLGPIGDLYKQQVVALAKYMELPSVVWEKPPTADLWSGQTDEGELGFQYDDADRYLYHRVDLRKTFEEILSEGFDATIANQIERRIEQSHFKRVTPPIAKLQARTIGIDFLYARDSGT